MTLLQTALLGLVQGATEFLPISSSGHLVLIPWLFNWREPGLSFTAIIHWGTLAAVLAVFWRDLARILSAVLESLKTRSLTNPEARIGVWILLGTIPTVSIGYIFEEDFNHFFRNPSVVAGFLLLTSIILLLGERQAVQNHSTDEMRWYDALLIGLAQAVAIMPGISRSGITISVGLLLGLQRTSAARFSFLLMIPATLGAGIRSLMMLFREGDILSELPIIFCGLLAATISGFFFIRWLMTYLARRRLTVFAAYCAVIGLGGLLLSVLRG